MPERGPLDYKLLDAWAKERSFVHLRGLCALALLFLLGLPLYAFLDWFLSLPWPARLVLMGVLLVAAGIVARRQWWRHLRRFDPLRAALQIERCHPQLLSRLVSYVQLAPETAAKQSASPQLVLALREEATQAAMPLDFERIVDFSRLKWLWVSVAVASTLFLMGSAARSDYARAALLRLANPRAKYPTRTRIEVLVPEATVPQGALVELRFRGSGLVPGEGLLRMRSSGEERDDKMTLLREDGNIFHYRVESVRQSFEFSFLLGDADSGPSEIRVVPRPSVKEFKVTCTAPPYTGRPPESQDKTLNLRVLEDTQIEWRLVFDLPLERVGLLLDRKAKPPRVQLSPDGAGATVYWTASQATPYRFAWTPKGYAFDFTDELEYTVEMKPDEPPRVDILQPEGDEKATVNWKVPIKFRASDDYGLLQARLVFWKADGKEQRRDLGALGTNPAEGETQWRPKDNLPNLQPGDVISYCIEVSDNYPAPKGPHWSRSQVQTISVMKPEEYSEFVRAERERLNAELETMMKAEESDSQGLKELKEKLQH